MKKIFLVFIFLISFSILLLPAHPAQAFMSLVDNVGLACMECGACNICDILQVIVNFGKFIFVTMAGLVMLFFMWQSIGLIINWGNAEAIKTAMDKIKNTLLAALIILAAYLLVSLLVNMYSGNGFKTLIKGQISADWNIGPRCEATSCQTVNSGSGTEIVTNNGSAGCKSSWESADRPLCGGNCGDLPTRNINPNQCGDASPSLTYLLKCIALNLNNASYPNLLGQTLYVNSVSHNNGLMHCRENYDSSCEHSRNSCHFGGGTLSNGSYAVDIDNLTTSGSQVDFDTLEDLVKVCDKGAYIKNEGDHIHISTSECPRN